MATKPIALLVSRMLLRDQKVLLADIVQRVIDDGLIEMSKLEELVSQHVEGRCVLMEE